MHSLTPFAVPTPDALFVAAGHATRREIRDLRRSFRARVSRPRKKIPDAVFGPRARARERGWESRRSAAVTRQTWRPSAAKGRNTFNRPSAQTFAPVTGVALEMGDGVNGDIIGFLDIEDRVGEGLAEVPPQRFGHDAEKTRGGAHVGNQPVDFIVEPSGEGVALLR